MGLTFDAGSSQWVELNSWSGIPPCLTHPDSCTGGASVTAWIKLSPTCPNWGGIFGTQGHGATATDDTEGLVVGCDGPSGLGLKYVQS